MVISVKMLRRLKKNNGEYLTKKFPTGVVMEVRVSPPRVKPNVNQHYCDGGLIYKKHRNVWNKHFFHNLGDSYQNRKKNWRAAVQCLCLSLLERKGA